MAFEALLNNSTSEPKLLDLLISEVQRNYDHHQNTIYFFKLDYIGEKNSKIIWQKTFSSRDDFADFYYDTKFMRTAIMLKFCKGRYEVLCLGFFYSDRFEIWPDKTLNHRPMERQHRNEENFPMPPRELLDRGFGEIAEALAGSKSNIPV
ncbi:MAG: hypothetical protein SGJ18_14655 [Pseudomonadota bacterium]|nr:hypothetical protein [Pseudomonadota bacterium]